jgi:hypothetical protein
MTNLRWFRILGFAISIILIGTAWAFADSVGPDSFDIACDDFCRLNWECQTGCASDTLADCSNRCDEMSEESMDQCLKWNDCDSFKSCSCKLLAENESRDKGCGCSTSPGEDGFGLPTVMLAAGIGAMFLSMKKRSSS